MFIDIFRSLFFAIDSIVYGFIPDVYNFLVVLSKQEVFDVEQIQIIADNIYALLGVFIIFRLAFVLLKSIIDPDMLDDKEKGASKFVFRVVVALALITIIPWGFQQARNFQDVIIENNALQKIVFGEESADLKNAGNTTASNALNAFITTEDSGKSEDMKKALTKVIDGDNTEAAEILNNKKDDDKDKYIYNYSFIISTVCGIVIALILITFSIDVATRVAKLGFLQIIAPIAVFGYIEPKGTIFSKWLKVVVSTYLNLFLRLLSLYFATYIIGLVGDIPDEEVTGIIKTFLIMGILFFAKEAPKLLLTILGISEESISSLNPFKKLKDMPGAGVVGAAGGIGAKFTGGAIGGVAGGLAANNRGGSFIAGMAQGAKAGFGNVKLGDAYKGGVTGMGKSLLGGTFGAAGAGGGYVASKITGKEGTKTGVLESLKAGMANKAAEMHAMSMSAEEAKQYEAIQNRKRDTGSYYRNADYSALVDSRDASKNKLGELTYERQKYMNMYEKDPNGTYLAEDGTYRFNKEAYETADRNFNLAQKTVDYYQQKIEGLDKLPNYQQDAADRTLIEKTALKEKVSNAKFEEIPGRKTGL